MHATYPNRRQRREQRVFVSPDYCRCKGLLAAKPKHQELSSVLSVCSCSELSCPLNSRYAHFASWLKALSIGSLEIPISPPKGSSNSRIRKIAPETASAETVKARIVVALSGASTLKPRKMMTTHKTSMINIGFDIEGTDCASRSDRT